MSPDDPRHGEVRGYRAHRRDDEKACLACLAALARYKKVREFEQHRGRPRLVPRWRLTRRVEALQRIGYSLAMINDESGLGTRWLHSELHMPGDWVTRTSLEKVDSAYRRLSGTAGPSSRARLLAERRGHASPLAWDDIDNPDELPNLGGIDDDIDPVVVDRLLHLERVTSTRAEKVEAVRRWITAGKSEAAICAAHGWLQGRYVEREDGAA